MRLLQLASPTLPGVRTAIRKASKAAIDAGVVSDAVSAEQWIGDVMEFSIARLEAPVLFRLIPGIRTEMESLNALFLASRETAELRAETVDMGYSLEPSAAEPRVSNTLALEEPAFPAAFATAVNAWSHRSDDAAASVSVVLA